MKRVGIVYSDAYRKVMCCSSKFAQRYGMVMDLINAYGLIQSLHRIPPLDWLSDAFSEKVLTTYHTTEYVDAVHYLDQLYQQNEEPTIDPDKAAWLEELGLTYDCPGFANVFSYAAAPVAGSLAAAEALITGQCQIAINWAGGWHHAKRTEASGFCYFNDAVCAIIRLRSSTLHNASGEPASNRVLYIDLDLHHGDGVEEAFWRSSQVVTFSVHHGAPGFFPGTGYHSDLPPSVEQAVAAFKSGAGAGRYAAFNLPLSEGLNDTDWCSVVIPTLEEIHNVVRPAYVVIQCGADGLANDPHKVFNLTSSAYESTLRKVLSWKVPLLILGGGGYHFPDTARLWTQLTATAVHELVGTNMPLQSDIPEHSYFLQYGPSFELEISATTKPNSNSSGTLTFHCDRLHRQTELYSQCYNQSSNEDKNEPVSVL